MRNIRLALAYDGTNYVGWQVQPNGVSVQAKVEEAIHKLTGERPRIMAAGRTDSGVHALAQMVNFAIESPIACNNIRTGIQNFLPDDIVVSEAVEVDADFHATYSAKTKRYRYVIYNSRTRNPLLRTYVWHVSVELDVPAMREAGQVLVGTHDFRCFESQYPNKASSVRTITELGVEQLSDWEVWRDSTSRNCDFNAQAPFVCIDVEADGFLYNMVRAIVGTLFNVGRGRWTPNDVRRVLESRDRAQAGETAPAYGLYLLSVSYDGGG